MIIVFVPDERISLGSVKLTADEILRETMNEFFKSATETSFYRNIKDGTGKPHKRETQNLVGELCVTKRSNKGTHLCR